ncbi:hypothetical protein MtrunA17_Chr7g0219151 [Medicago truncatula]|uniref:Uncharacterized protein n=1 Tax=Medicago truncatula TaxID=3880 RepID=A0A396GTN4_MEDTR|nr:hypothetical protein MtrunA17_Chr7g0219151 [Medicago truncatula]
MVIMLKDMKEGCIFLWGIGVLLIELLTGRKPFDRYISFESEIECHAKERAKSGEMGFPFDGYQLVMEEEEDNVERATRIFLSFDF